MTAPAPSPDPNAELLALIERLEGADDGSRELDAEIALHLFPDVFKDATADSRKGAGHWMHPEGGHMYAQDYTTSLGAALTLVPDHCACAIQIPGKRNTSGSLAFADVWHLGLQEGVNPGVFAKTPALALSIAALKARLV